MTWLNRSSASHLGLAAALIGLVGLGAPAFAGRTAGDPQPSPERIWDAAKKDSRAYELLKELTTSIGPRLTGTEKGRQAEAWAIAQFRAAGYANAQFAPFTFQRWVRGPLSLTVAGRNIPVTAFGGSPARADIGSDIVEMGDGIDANYTASPDKVRGKIALVYYTVLPDSPDDTPFLTRAAKIKLAIRYGARAIVFINRGTENYLSTGTAFASGPSPIPVLMVGHQDGMGLRAQLKKGAQPAHIAMTNSVGRAVARNVVALLPGTDPRLKRVVIGAHLDSWDLATGALDNGAGATSIIDMARIFKARGYRPRRTIEFVVYMGEEQGAFGSAALLRRQQAAGTEKSIGYTINSDMSYDPAALNTWGFDADKAFFGSLSADLHRLSPTFSSDIANRPMPGGDPQPYIVRGIPVLYLMGREGPDAIRCQHADCDRLDIIRPDLLRETVAAQSVILFRLANAERLPTGRLTGKALKDYLDHNELEP